MLAEQLIKYDKKAPVFQSKNLPKPQIKDNEVLVKVHYTTVNPLDNLIASGGLKMLMPYHLPVTLGQEVVGQIEKVGPNVQSFQIGQRVYAMLPKEKIGGWAEDVAVAAKYLALVPDYLSDEEAVTVPLTALTAEQALNLLDSQAGKTIFISGGTGSLGAMAIPLAKNRGLTVITNGSKRNERRVKELGVDQFIDYHTQDYSQFLHNIDYVLDTRGNQEIPKEIGVLKRGGHLVSLIGSPNRAFAKRFGVNKFLELAMKVIGHKFDRLAAKRDATYDFMMVESNGPQLRKISRILAIKKIKPSIDSIYSFAQLKEAIAKVKTGHSSGKVVVKIS